MDGLLWFTVRRDAPYKLRWANTKIPRKNRHDNGTHIEDRWAVWQRGLALQATAVRDASPDDRPQDRVVDRRPGV